MFAVRRGAGVHNSRWEHVYAPICELAGHRNSGNLLCGTYALVGGMIDGSYRDLAE